MGSTDSKISYFGESVKLIMYFVSWKTAYSYSIFTDVIGNVGKLVNEKCPDASIENQILWPRVQSNPDK